MIDLYTYHRPDGVTPLEETLAAMNELVDEGRVRWLGLSNVDAGHLRAAAESGVTVVAVQNRYSLLHRADDAEVLPLCRELGIGYVPYFPLASGLLTGKYRRGEAAPAGSRLSAQHARRAGLRRRRGTGGGGRRVRSHAARARGRRARLDPGDRLGDRGRDEPGAGSRERLRGRLARSASDLEAIARAAA